MMLDEKQADAFVNHWISVCNEYEKDAEMQLKVLEVFCVMACTMDLNDAVIRGDACSYVLNIMGAHTNSVEIQIKGFSAVIYLLGFNDDSMLSNENLKWMIHHMNEMSLIYFCNDDFAGAVEDFKMTIKSKYGDDTPVSLYCFFHC